MTAKQYGDSAMIAGDVKKKNNIVDDVPEKNAQGDPDEACDSACKTYGTCVNGSESDAANDKPDNTKWEDSTQIEFEGFSSDEDERPETSSFQELANWIGRLEAREAPAGEKVVATAAVAAAAVDFEDDRADFHRAVRRGDAEAVAAAIARGCVQDLNEPDWNVTGDPPLLVAATNHCLPVLSTLLKNKCDPTVRSPRGETALHRAILNGGPGNVVHFVEELLKHGCPATVKEAGGGLTALHILTRQLAHTHIAKSLRHNFDDALRTLDLLAKASQVNAKDHQGQSALHILASSTTFDTNQSSEIEKIIKILLDAGADPSLPNDRGETPLHESLECGALKTAALLMQHTPVGLVSRYGETPLHIAARKNYTDTVARLLEHGEDASLQDAGGNTALHLASARGFHQVVSLLVTSPMAQLERTNNEGLTALQVATESGFANAVRLLLQAGADPSHSETTARSSTLRHRHPDISVLIAHELTRRRQLAA